EPGDVLAEVVESLDEGGAAEQVGEDASFVGSQSRRLADGVGVVLVEDEEVPPARMSGDDTDPITALAHELVSEPDTRQVGLADLGHARQSGRPPGPGHEVSEFSCPSQRVQPSPVTG